MIEKIMLIQPSSIMPSGSIKRVPTPMGLMYLGAVLRDRGYEVNILDSPCQGGDQIAEMGGRVTYGLSDSEVQQRVRDFSPDLIGVTSMFTAQQENALHHCDLARQVSDAPIVLGGIHPSLDPGSSAASNSVDYVIMGEGEERLVKLIHAIEQKKSPDFDGVAFKDRGEIRINPRTTRLEDLDSIPLPARELVDMERYIQIGAAISPFIRRDRVEQMMTSRGCVFDCIFCPSVQYWGHRLVMRGVENVLKEVRHLAERYGVQELQLFDDNLTFNKDRAKEIFKGLRGLGLSWCTPNGLMAQTIDDEMIDLMAQSGAYQISLAIESGSERVRREIIRKPVPNKSRIKQIISRCHYHGIQVHGFFVVGFPGESRAEIDETLRYPYDAGFDSVSVYTASPMYGSRLFRLCQEKGYLDEGGVGDIKKTEIIIPPSSADFVMDKSELDALVESETRKFNDFSRQSNPEAWTKKFAVFLKKHPEQASLIYGRST